MLFYSTMTGKSCGATEEQVSGRLGRWRLSGDEKPRVVVGLNGGGGITMLDENGKKVWHQSDRNVWHVECWKQEKRARQNCS